MTLLRRAEQAARDLSGQLIHAEEEERSQLARELHDDGSQRLAILTIEALQAERMEPTSTNWPTRQTLTVPCGCTGSCRRRCATPSDTQRRPVWTGPCPKVPTWSS
jgi:hypothetical protein